MTLAAPPAPEKTAPVKPTDDPLLMLLHWQKAGFLCAVATVVRTWGSSPRPVGSKLAVREDGLMAGSVSGGCVEAAVVEAALQVMDSGKPQLLSFGVADARAWEVGLACGGRIDIFVEPLTA